MENNRTGNTFIDDSFMQELSNMSSEQFQSELEKAQEIMQKSENIEEDFFDKDKSYERFLVKVNGKEKEKKNVKAKRLQLYLKVASFFAVTMVMMLAVVGSVQAINQRGEAVIGIMGENEQYLQINDTKAMLAGYSVTNKVLLYDDFEEVEGFAGNFLWILDAQKQIQLDVQMEDDMGNPLVAYFSIKYVIDELEIDSFITLRDVPELLVSKQIIDNDTESFAVMLDNKYEVTINKYDEQCIATVQVDGFDYCFRSKCSVEKMVEIIKSLERCQL